ncbi:MAG: hypothetical protein KL863_14090 [Rhizobium sp.]|jgi:hypothetical protein|nr:hypothetical protein [Rhizobium sp.]
MKQKPAAIALLLALSAQGALASECTQEKAVYGDRDGAYELSLQAEDSEASSSSYRFTVTVKNTDVKLDGFVMGSEPVDRTNGILFHNCPEGDTTGAEITKCTVWQGVIYAADSGKIGLLPMTGSPAASEILLPGFALGLVESTAWGQGKATVVPWDVLSFKGCQS